MKSVCFFTLMLTLAVFSGCKGNSSDKSMSSAGAAGSAIETIAAETVTIVGTLQLDPEIGVGTEAVEGKTVQLMDDNNEALAEIATAPGGDFTLQIATADLALTGGIRAIPRVAKLRSLFLAEGDLGVGCDVSRDSAMREGARQTDREKGAGGHPHRRRRHA